MLTAKDGTVFLMGTKGGCANGARCLFCARQTKYPMPNGEWHAVCKVCVVVHKEWLIKKSAQRL